MTYVWVAVGGAVGSVVRYMVSSIINVAGFKAFPYATLIVNTVGSYLIGLVSFHIWHKGSDQQMLQLFIVTGFLGGFTTFSAFSYETLQLIYNEHIQAAVLNIMLNVTVGLIAVWLGWQTFLRI